MVRFVISIIFLLYFLVAPAQEEISYVAPAQKDILSEARSNGFNNIDEYAEAYNYCTDHYFKIAKPLDQKSKCSADVLCKMRESEEKRDRIHKQMCSPEWALHKCGSVMQRIITDHKGVEMGIDKKFEIVAASQTCRYFVVAQKTNYFLVEDSLCHCPERGDIGYGIINSRGFKEVILNSVHCQIYVDEVSLNESRAFEIMGNRCQR